MRDINGDYNDFTERVNQIVQDLNDDYSNIVGKPIAIKRVRQAQSDLNNYGYSLKMQGKKFYALTGTLSTSTSAIDSKTPTTITTGTTTTTTKANNTTKTTPTTNTTTGAKPPETTVVTGVTESGKPIINSVNEQPTVLENIKETVSGIFGGGGGGGAMPEEETQVAATPLTLKEKLYKYRYPIIGVAIVGTLIVLKYKKII